MSEVRMVCMETRLIGTDKYIAGATYAMDAERAGKYRASFRPVTDSDGVEADAAWEARLAKEAEREVMVREATFFDPSLLKAAALVIQEMIANGGVAALGRPAKQVGVRGGPALPA